MKTIIALVFIFLIVTCYSSFLVTAIDADDTLWNYFVGENIQDIAISADGASIVLIDSMATISALDQFGNLKWTHQFPQSPYNVPNIGFVDISKTGSTIVASCLQEHEYGRIEVICFNQNGDELWSTSFSGDFERSGIRSAISLSDDGNLIALIGMRNYNRALFLYNREGTEVWVEEQQKPTEIKLSLDGNFMLVGDNSEPWRTSPYGELHLFSYETKWLWTKNHDQHCTSLDISYDGSIISCGCANKIMYVYNKTGDQMFTFSTSGTELFVDVSADGSTVALGSNDEKVVLFNQNGTKLWDYETSSSVRSVSLSENGSSLAAGCENGKVYLYAKNGTLLWSYKTGNSAKVSLSNNGINLAIGSSDAYTYFIPEFSSCYVLPIILIITTLLVLTYKNRILEQAKSGGS